MTPPSAALPTPPKHRTLVDYFQHQVRERGPLAALYYRDSGHYAAISWAEFGTTSRELAAYLISEGVAEQDHVAIWSGNTPQWHIADMSILRDRCRPVPVYLTLSAEQGAYVLGHSESRVIFVENTTILERVLEVRSQLPSVLRIVVMNNDVPAGNPLVMSWDAATAQGRQALTEATISAEVDRRASAVQIDDIATLIYTSGTTGPPKAVTLTHANIAAVIEALSEFVDSNPDQRVLSYLPLAHIAERLVSEFRSYVYGNPTYFLDGIAHLGQRLKEVQPTQFFAVPRIWEKMAQTIKNEIEATSGVKHTLATWALGVGAKHYAVTAAGKRSNVWLGSQHVLADKLVLHKLRTALGLDQATMLASGAAPISAEVLTFFASMGLEICEVYGQTEDTGVATMNRPGHAHLGTVGTPTRGVEVHIAEDGEILVRGDSVFKGYYKDPTATAEALVDGWLHTGDVGEFDAEGFLRITDRKKDLIITAGGKNIAPSNIESALKQHPLVANAVAIGDRRPYVTALLTLDPEEAARFAKQRGLPTDLEQLAASDAVRTELTQHVSSVNKQLSHVEQVKKWKLLAKDFVMGDELTPTLKVKRKVVAEKYAGDIEGLYTK